MQTVYNIIKSLTKSHTPEMNFDSFQLISKLPLVPYYNQTKFIPIIHKTDDIPKEGLYFNKEISCADDMVYHAINEFNDIRNKNIVEYKALGFNDRFKEVLMQASQNLLCEKAGYIIFTCNTLGGKYNNPILGIYKNNHPNADKNMKIEYEIYTTI